MDMMYYQDGKYAVLATSKVLTVMMKNKSHECEMDCKYEEPLSDNDDPESAMHVANTSLDISDVSPMKFHGIEKRRRVAVVKEKRQRSFRRQETQAAMAVGIDRKELDQCYRRAKYNHK